MLPPDIDPAATDSLEDPAAALDATRSGSLWVPVPGLNFSLIEAELVALDHGPMSPRNPGLGPKWRGFGTIPCDILQHLAT